MAHRGRLNVLAHVVGVSYAAILADFERSRPTAEADLPPEGETSDVKYHRGAEGVYAAAGGPIRVRVSANPSHLEAIDPVIEGRARAEQTDRSAPGDRARTRPWPCPLLIHGDAAFAAQGVVAETFNLARLDGYTTGGTIHLIARQPARLHRRARGRPLDRLRERPRQGLRRADRARQRRRSRGLPLGAVRLAVAYRELFHGDFVIDVVGYRRHGHNEEDEPAYTQPLLYERIAAHPTVRALYLQRLAEEGVIEAGAAEAELEQAVQRLAEIQASLGSDSPGSVTGRDDGAAVRRPEPPAGPARAALPTPASLRIACAPSKSSSCGRPTTSPSIPSSSASSSAGAKPSTVVGSPGRRPKRSPWARSCSTAHRSD